MIRLRKFSYRRKKVRVSYIYSVMHAFMYAYIYLVHNYACRQVVALQKTAFGFRSHIFSSCHLFSPLPNASSMYCHPKCKSSSLFSSVRTRTRLTGRFRSRQPIPISPGISPPVFRSSWVASFFVFLSFHPTFFLKEWKRRGLKMISSP